MVEVEEEVAAEGRGQLVMVSRSDEANRRLLARLRQQPPVPARGDVCREGFFTLIRLPDAAERPDLAGSLGAYADFDWGGPSGVWGFDELSALLASADVLLYLFERAADSHVADVHWYARLRAIGVPLLPVVLMELPVGRELAGDAADTAPDGEQAGLEELVRALRLPAGVRPVWVRAGAGEGDVPEVPADVVGLVERILALRPRLAIPLAQEIPCCRQMIAQRMIRRSALLTTLLGVEPLPLVDLPLHVAVNWKVALQLAAIHGRPGLDYRSREMVGTVALNLGLRYTTQQLVKLVPVLGWLASAALSGLTTWLLGHALLRYYQGQRLLPIADSCWRIGGRRLGIGGWRAEIGSWGARVKDQLTAVSWPRLSRHRRR
jgi:uncharacterized protein (DUF697 family)